MLKKAPDDRSYLQALAQAATEWSPEIANAIARILPPELKALVYGRSHKTIETPLVSPPEPIVEPLLTGTPADSDEHWPEVLLLGTAQEQDADLSLGTRAVSASTGQYS